MSLLNGGFVSLFINNNNNNNNNNNELIGEEWGKFPSDHSFYVSETALERIKLCLNICKEKRNKELEEYLIKNQIP